MAIDYIIDQQCKVKETLSLNGMLSMIKQRNRALLSIELMKKDGKTEEEARNSIFKVQTLTADGKMETKDCTALDLLNSTKPLDELQNFCKNCIANFGKTSGYYQANAFGCYKVINYPISKKAESWLIDVSKNALEKGAPGSLPLQFIHDQKIAGDIFNRMRKDPNGTFFELQKPLEIVTSKGLFVKKVINTNQIFDILFGMQRMKIPHMIFLLFFSGGLVIQDKEPTPGTNKQAIRVTKEDGQNSWWIFNLEDKDTDDDSILQLKEFFRSLFIAYGLNTEMIIDI